jgi:hypothetical protein
MLTTKESGLMASVGAMARKNGVTAHFTKVSGKKTKPMELGLFSTQMGTSTRGTGKTIKPMAKALTHTPTRPNMSGTGLKTARREKESKCGPMVLATMVRDKSFFIYLSRRIS